MNDKRHFTLLKALSQGVVCITEDLEKKLDVGSRTLRTLIKTLNEELIVFGAEIKRKRGIGYQLEVWDEQLFAGFLMRVKTEERSEKLLPATPSERVQYLLGLLLNLERHIKLDELSDMLYISRRVLSDDLKEVEAILQKYHLGIERRANYGIRVTGEERDVRRCMIDCVYESQVPPWKAETEQELSHVDRVVRQCIKLHKLKMSELAIRNIIIHIYTAICRIRNQHYAADNGKFDKKLYALDYDAANYIADAIYDEFGLDFPEAEIGYIAVRLAGMKMFDGNTGLEQNLIVTPEISSLVLEMLKTVKDAFQIDLNKNLELRMSLSQHIVPMTARIRFGLKLKNPLLTDIKKRFSLAYAIAGQACTVINHHYDTELSDDEIGYVALAFALALETEGTKPRCKNVLLVCATGKGSAKLLQYKYQQEFGDYIHHIETCDVGELDRIDFHKFDYLFTTVPIPISVPIVIQEIDMFLGEEDISKVKRILSQGSHSSIEKYVVKELFLSELKAATKEDVLKAMCSQAEQFGLTEDGFYEAVSRREAMANTDFGELVAMPHPDRCVSKRTFVCVGILEKPVFWGKRNVQVVFLVAVSDKPDQELQMFYQTIARFLLNGRQIQELIQKQNYQELVTQLRRIEQDVKNGGN